jgi:hypothetical protein
MERIVPAPDLFGMRGKTRLTSTPILVVPTIPLHSKTFNATPIINRTVDVLSEKVVTSLSTIRTRRVAKKCTERFAGRQGLACKVIRATEHSIAQEGLPVS